MSKQNGSTHMYVNTETYESIIYKMYAINNKVRRKKNFSVSIIYTYVPYTIISIRFDSTIFKL